MPENNEMSRVKNKNAQKQQKHKNKKGKQHKNKSVWKILLFGFLFLIVAAIIGGAGLFAYYASSAPELTDKDLTDIVSKDLVDADGNVFYTLGAEERDPVKTENIPQVLADAIVSVEDQRFYKHSGVDPIGITRAAVGYVTNKGRIVGGGSTITQQLVKLSVFSTKSEDKNIKRKAQEAWLALKLERKLSKQQILTLYINKVYMAENQYGMGTAAEHYYGKDISELNVAEAALLAGMPKAPNSYNPRSNPEQATKRRNTVLQLMYEEKTISKEELDNAKETSIQDGLVELEDEQETNNLVYDAYVSQVLDEIKEKTDLDPYTSNIKTIYTNLDLDAQNQVYSVLNSDDYSIFPNDDMQAAVSVVDVNTGQLKAIGGGRKQDSLRALNRAQARTEIGSTVKPLGTYGPAIEHLKLSTYEQVIDSPTTYKSGQKIHNYDNKYEGQISMRRALVNSRNVPTYKINQQIDKSDIQDFLHNLGIQSLNGDPDDTAFHESNAFNGALSMIDLSAAYASFANGGEYTEPYAVSKIVLQTGEETDLTPQSHKAMSDYTAYMITDMLKDVAETGTTGRLVNIPGVAQAGKTGTPNYRSEDKEKYNIPKDAVPATAYVGYTTNYSISVWAGYDKRFEQGHWLASGDNTRQIPRNIYQSIMSHLSQSVKNDDWTMPDSVVPLKVVRGSMPVVLANSGTPSSQTVTELFVKGAEPKQSSSSSYGQKMPSPTGLSASYDQSADQVHIKWNNYSFNGSTGSASYRLKVGNRTYSTDSNSYVIKNPAKGNLTISLAAIVQGQTSPATSTTVTLSSSENKEESSESSSEEAEESSESSSEE
ncbi:MAG: transglycosylase domain-containing protein, partial [Pisciglobus halotolerans]|nr:transglycosylase domain-containing protein [Pisciglobus halotolerans]